MRIHPRAAARSATRAKPGARVTNSETEMRKSSAIMCWFGLVWFGPLSFINISGGAAPILASVIGVSPKTWRISASADARSA